LVDEEFFDRFSIPFDKTGVVHPDAEGQRQPEVLILDVHAVQVRLVHVEPHLRIFFTLDLRNFDKHTAWLWHISGG
jgi:hypothetical protein